MVYVKEDEDGDTYYEDGQGEVLDEAPEGMLGDEAEEEEEEDDEDGDEDDY